MSEFVLIDLQNYKLSTDNDLNNIIQKLTVILHRCLDSKKFNSVVKECKNLNESQDKCDIVFRLIEEVSTVLISNHELLEEKIRVSRELIKSKVELIYKREDEIEDLKEKIILLEQKNKNKSFSVNRDKSLEIDLLARNKKLEIELEHSKNTTLLLKEKLSILQNQDRVQLSFPIYKSGQSQMDLKEGRKSIADQFNRLFINF